MAASTTTNNNCVICLEPLLAAKCDEAETTSPDGQCDLGVANCGHPCHFSCFEDWKKFKGTAVGSVPCPTCQQKTTSFLRVFLHAEKKAPQAADIDADISDFSDDDHDDGEEEDGGEEEEEDSGDSSSANSSGEFSQPLSSNTNTTSNTSASPGEKKRRSKWQKIPSAPRKKSKKQQLSPKAHKKLFHYKYNWKLTDLRLRVSQARMEMMKKEAENRKRCHHDDLIELQHSQLVNFKLAQELEQFEDAARFKRNVLAGICFGVGIVWGKLRLYGFRS